MFGSEFHAYYCWQLPDLDMDESGQTIFVGPNFTFYYVTWNLHAFLISSRILPSYCIINDGMFLSQFFSLPLLKKLLFALVSTKNVSSFGQKANNNLLYLSTCHGDTKQNVYICVDGKSTFFPKTGSTCKAGMTCGQTNSLTDRQTGNKTD